MAEKKYDEFYSSTLNGVELKVKFAFPKVYFTKDPADKDKRIYYDIGVLADIGWSQSTTAAPQYALGMIKAMDITSGMSITEGNMTFKTFHHESLSLIKRKVLEGINNGRDKIEFPDIEDNPFITLEDVVEDLIFDVQSDPDKVNWSQMPLFDILLFSQSSQNFNNKKIKVKEIKGVKFSSQGFAESIESLEINTMSSFIAIGEITDWSDIDE